MMIGPAMLFVILLVAVAIAAVFIFPYAAHCFLTIAQQTAAGLDEMAWPSSPWYDWIGEVLHLAWLVALWFFPAMVVLRWVRPESAVLDLLALATLFWLLFPVFLLSSFSSGSPWVLFRFEVVRRMAHRPLMVGGYYVLSVPLCLAGGAALYGTLAQGWFFALPVLATVLFIYARLIGRLVRLLGQVGLAGANADAAIQQLAARAHVEVPWEDPRAAPRQQRRRRKKKKQRSKAYDPWAVPEEDEAAEEAQETFQMPEGYEVAEEPWRTRTDAAEKHPPPLQAEGYRISAEATPAQPAQEQTADPPLQGLNRDLSGAELPLPSWPLVNGVFSFPWYSANLGTWGLLTLLLLGWACLYVAMQRANPM